MVQSRAGSRDPEDPRCSNLAHGNKQSSFEIYGRLQNAEKCFTWLAPTGDSLHRFTLHLHRLETRVLLTAELQHSTKPVPPDRSDGQERRGEEIIPRTPTSHQQPRRSNSHSIPTLKPLPTDPTTTPQTTCLTNMSENIPESIPRSADPTSRRPLKRARPSVPDSQRTSASLQRSINMLMADPEREVSIPDLGSGKRAALAPPPEIVQNVQGSSAGAGSGEFHRV